MNSTTWTMSLKRMWVHGWVLFRCAPACVRVLAAPNESLQRLVLGPRRACTLRAQWVIGHLDLARAVYARMHEDQAICSPARSAGHQAASTGSRTPRSRETAQCGRTNFIVYLHTSLFLYHFGFIVAVDNFVDAASGWTRCGGPEVAS